MKAPLRRSARLKQKENCTSNSKILNAKQPQKQPPSSPSTNGASIADPGIVHIKESRSDPLVHWAATGCWPKNFSNMSYNQTNSSRKRPLESSYAQRNKDGRVPKAYTRAFEQRMARNGIIMHEDQGERFLSEASLALCKEMTQVRYEESQQTQFPLSKFGVICDRLRTRNEARLLRDITPILVPSAEHLFYCGHNELEHLVEEISVDWRKSDPMGGPKPRPDFAVGIAETAFSDDEISTMELFTSWERATQFTDDMYFPFLLCEAKSGDQGLNRADRQNSKSSSMAVNAVIQLYRMLPDNQARHLNGQILAFSVSHDHEKAKVYGHYAVVEGAKTTHYRYLVLSVSLNFRQEQGREKMYSFVREVYNRFYPEHLKRIRDALASITKEPWAKRIKSSTSLPEGR